MSACPWKIRWTFDKDAACTKDEHVRNLTIANVPDGRLVVDYDGDGEHSGQGLFPGQVITWRAGDRREFTGEWPGPCTGLRGCTLHTGHNGRHAP